MDLFTLAMAKNGDTDRRVITCIGNDPVFVGMDLTPSDFYDAIIVYSDDGDWVRVGSTATNLNTITFRNTESNSNFYFYYSFDDGCVHRHNG